MRVKVELDHDESPEQAEETLFKALNSQRNGDQHESEKFLDPAMEHQVKLMSEAYQLILKQMEQEILQEISKS